jgi:hypothetical protein
VGLAGRLFRHGLGLCQGKKGGGCACAPLSARALVEGSARAQRGAPVGLSGRLFRHGLGLCQGKKGGCVCSPLSARALVEGVCVLSEALQWVSLVDFSVMAWGYVKVRKGGARVHL